MTRPWVALIVLVTFAGPAAADPDAAIPAVRALLAANATPLPPHSGCEGSLPGIARPDLGALVASRIAYLDGGTNRVTGSCGVDHRCTVAITHADGEDVESAEFRFRTGNGRLAPASLRCVLTP